MAIRKKKISELTLSDSLTGLYTIGVKLINGVQTSVKVSLGVIQTAYENMLRVTQEAITATSNAITATNNANTATRNAVTATENANTATANANEAIRVSGVATQRANEATNKANTAADKADEARVGLDRIKQETITATSNANTAKNNANEATGDARVVIARLEELEESLISKYKLIPTSMKLNYPKKVTYRNTQPFKVEVELLPVDTGRNVLFLGDDRAVSITPDGVFMVNGVGMSKIHVIPTENTGIYQTIQIEVQEPGIRFTSGRGMRLSGSGGIILT